jgi:hypothetical protein
VQQNLTLTAVPAAPDLAHNQIQGKRATGQLTFINNGSTPITIQSTTISGHSGVQVSFTGPITIPAVPPSSAVVTGFAVNAGAAGNIPVLDIVEPCCATNIVVKNTTIFTGYSAPARHADRWQKPERCQRSTYATGGYCRRALQHARYSACQYRRDSTCAQTIARCNAHGHAIKEFNQISEYI